MTFTDKRFILALDQGTTSSRAILFDSSGMPFASAHCEFTQHTPAPGIVEHDPEEIWQSQLTSARIVLEKAGVVASMIAGIGVTNQRETTILWDRHTGTAVAPAIVWQSRVSAPLCEQFREAGFEEEIRKRTGLVLDPYFSATKIRHLLDTIPGLRARCESGDVLFGTVDTFLLWRLSGGLLHITDPTNASRTMLYDIVDGAWSDQLCEKLGVPRCILPSIRSSSEVYGMCESKWFGAEIPLAGCAGDQQSAAYGQGCISAGQAKNTYGTGAFLFFATGSDCIESRHGLLTSRACDVGGASQYCLEGSVFIAGAVVGWLRDGLGIIQTSAEVESLALRVSQTDGVVFVPALTGLGAPHWDPYARGLLIGLSRGTTAAHIARASLEAIAFQVCDIVSAMQSDSGSTLQTLRVDGGASANNLLMQMQADLLGVPVERPCVVETTALGAALLAGRAVGFFDDSEALEARKIERIFLPNMDSKVRAHMLSRWHEAVDRSRRWESPHGDG